MISGEKVWLSFVFIETVSFCRAPLIYSAWCCKLVCSFSTPQGGRVEVGCDLLAYFRAFMIWLKQKGWNILTYCFSNSLACNCFRGTVGIIWKKHEVPWQAFRLLVYSLSYFIAAGFLLVAGTVPQLKYMNFHLFTSTGVLRVYFELITRPLTSLLDRLS